MCESVRRFFKSLSTRGMLSLMRNGVVCFMIDMSNGYDRAFPSNETRTTVGVRTPSWRGGALGHMLISRVGCPGLGSLKEGRN